jgi:hypothetical protein
VYSQRLPRTNTTNTGSSLAQTWDFNGDRREGFVLLLDVADPEQIVPPHWDWHMNINLLTILGLVPVMLVTLHVESLGADWRCPGRKQWMWLTRFGH